jgi:Putative 8-oxoguanine DNA glycosylase OGG-like protein
MATIDELVAGYRQEVEQQPITWRRANWEKLWEASPEVPGRGVLDVIDSEVSGSGAGTIRRSWIRGLADGDPVVFLAASTIWGFGNYVRFGRPALRAMLTSPNVEPITSDIVEASRRDAGDGFAELFDDRGRTRIKSLGIAFGTKVVHFAGYDHTTPKPLVLDSRNYASAQALDDRAPVPDPAAFTTGEQYRSYCAGAGEVAERNGVEPEFVEYVLFMDGENRR